jgi:hypothetical protein
VRAVGYSPVPVMLSTLAAEKFVIDLKVQIIPTTALMKELACAELCDDFLFVLQIYLNILSRQTHIVMIQNMVLTHHVKFVMGIQSIKGYDKRTHF